MARRDGCHASPPPCVGLPGSLNILGSMSATTSRAAGLSLPVGISPIKDVLEGSFPRGSKVSVVGLVTDFRAPVQLSTGEWKCQMNVYDMSSEKSSDRSLEVHVFRKWEGAMPDVECGDVIIISGAKVQKYNSEYCSLCVNHSPLFVFDASRIPKNALDAQRSYKPIKQGGRLEQPSPALISFVSILHSRIDKTKIPTIVDFNSNKEASAASNVRKKECELREVSDGQFANIIAQAVSNPVHRFDSGIVSLWITDWTENPGFCNVSFSSDDAVGGSVFGYGVKNKTSSEGPFGRRTMLVTCFDSQAEEISRLGVAKGSWLQLNSLFIKFGNDGANLEGFLRDDQKYAKKNVRHLDPRKDSDKISPAFKEALRRKRDYQESLQVQPQDMQKPVNTTGKREAETTKEGGGGKGRRKRKRNKAKLERLKKREEAAREEERDAAPVPAESINHQVRCEHPDMALSYIAQMLEPVPYDTTINNEQVRLCLPFIVANYRSIVRVVDFMPHDLTKFTRPKRARSEFHCLDDAGEGSDSDGADSMIHAAASEGWEWNFALQLEDGDVPRGEQKKRLWVLVDNEAAQCLLNLNASDLCSNPESVETLRERLFILWGELEERKAQTLAANPSLSPGGPPPHSSDAEGGGGGGGGDDDEEENTAAGRGKDAKAEVSSRPFACCLRQYGITVDEADRGRADAGEGKRYQRVFGLWGTRIAT